MTKAPDDFVHEVRELMSALQALNREHLIDVPLKTLEMMESMLHEQERRVRYERRTRSAAAVKSP